MIVKSSMPMRRNATAEARPPNPAPMMATAGGW
jgi:hypothetical protein